MINNELYTIISEMDFDDLIELSNYYTEQVGAWDYVYAMDDFDIIMCDNTPTEIAHMILFGNFRTTDDYFWFNGYGNLESGSSTYVQLPTEITDIVNYIVENDDDCGFEAIREALKEDY